jgi:hypothetical protein
MLGTHDRAPLCTTPDGGGIRLFLWAPRRTLARGNRSRGQLGDLTPTVSRSLNVAVGTFLTCSPNNLDYLYESYCRNF